MTDPNAHDDLWLLEEPEVTTLVLVSPAARTMASPQSFADAVNDATGLAVQVQLPEETPEEVTWLAAITVDGLPSALLCSLEPQAAAQTGLAEDDPTGLVVQTMLHPGDPLTCLLNVLTLLGAADPDAAGIIDANTGRWLDQDTIHNEIIEAGIEPRDDLLWVVEAEQYDDLWTLRTSGLARCGHRELAITSTPEGHVDAAADLLASIASLVLETALPASGQGIEIGPGLHLSVAADPEDPDEPILMLDEHGQGPPLDVLDRLTDGVVAIYRSRRATTRHTMLALTTWHRFLSLHDTLVSKGAQCFVEVAFEQPDGEEDRHEHVWMEITKRHGDAVAVTPAHEAELIEGLESLASRVEPAEVCSWRALFDDAAWGPEDIEALEARIRGEPG